MEEEKHAEQENMDIKQEKERGEEQEKKINDINNNARKECKVL